MPLFLIESRPASADRAATDGLVVEIESAVRAAGGEVLESHVAATLDRVFVVVEQADGAALRAALTRGGLSSADIVEVRLVGASPDDIRGRPSGASHLVEWEFPEELTMDRYLERKRANSVHYAKVPEVRFLRTYVREDMEKCLCLYDAPDEDCVRRAREAVSAPVTRLVRLEDA